MKQLLFAIVLCTIVAEEAALIDLPPDVDDLAVDENLSASRRTAEDDVVSWRRRWGNVTEEADGLPRWRWRVGSVNVGCTFRVRSGLAVGVPPEKGPALIFDDFMATPHAPHDDAFDGPALCEHNGGGKGPAQVMVANSLSYVLRNWPSFVNRILFAEAHGMRTFLFVGELPWDLAKTVSKQCLQSRQGMQLPCGGSTCETTDDDVEERRLRSVYFDRTDGRSWLNSNHYNKILASRIVLDHPGVTGIFYLDLDAYYSLDAITTKLPTVHDEDKYDLEFAGIGSNPFWCVKGGRFYARDVPWTRKVLDAWMSLRCGFKDQWSLWQALLTTASANSCLEYHDQLLNYTSFEAMKRSWRLDSSLDISIDKLHAQCPDFRYNSGRMTHSVTSKTMPIHRSVPPDRLLEFRYFDDDSNLCSFNVTNLLLNNTDDVVSDAIFSPQERLLSVFGLHHLASDPTRVF